MTSEYGVLDGAKAIALPTKLGQTLKVSEVRGSEISWESFTPDGRIWFKHKLSLFDFSSLEKDSNHMSERLAHILKSSCRLNSEFLSTWKGMKVETRLDFDPEWGLGSSSSLLYCIAEWADINPFLLHFEVSEGSGYDIACAGAEGPLLYQYLGDSISYEGADFDPPFSKSLFFVYVGKKQSSESEIKRYRQLKISKQKFVDELTKITVEIENCRTLGDFNKLLGQHEQIISATINRKRAKEEMFSDFWGEIKSLGAWGGDFVLVTSERSEIDTQKYFADKGCEIFFPYARLIK